LIILDQFEDLQQCAREMRTHLVFKLGTPVLLLAWLLPVSGCKKAGEQPAAMPPQVQVVAVEQRGVPVYLEFVGNLQGEVNATISAQVGGYLIARNYTEGSLVTNGQVLFQIQPASFEAALANARAQLAQAQAKKGKTALDVKRYTPLAATQAISQQELDDAIQSDLAADAEVQAGEASVQTAQINLDFTTIRSPVDGVAGLANAQIGDLVGPGSGALTSVAQINPIRVYFSVSQQLMTQIQERRLSAGGKLRELGDYRGPSLELVLASGSVYPRQGRVRFADNQVDVKTGTIRVVGEFDNPDGLLVPGMFVRVRALLETVPNALLVPQSAVVDMQGRYLLAVVGDDNKVSIRPVMVGETVGQLWVIKGNVKPGDRVVAEGVQKVRDGAEVNPVPLTVTDSAPAGSAEEAKP
jgi:RND family efflux transporter MFP subunit